jgi:hypothetical protein
METTDAVLEISERECFNKLLNPDFRKTKDRSELLKLASKVKEEAYLKQIAIEVPDIEIRLRTIDRISNIEMLKDIMYQSISQTVHYHIALRLNDPILWLELFFRNYQYCDFCEIDPSNFYKSILNQLKAMGYFQNAVHREKFINSVLNNKKKDYLNNAVLPSLSLPRLKEYALRDLRILALESRKNK